MRLIINIDVPDIRSAIDFYTSALDLKPSRIIEEDVAELIGASSIIYLLQKSAGTHPVSKLPFVRQYLRHWTPVHMDFVVDNVEKAAQQALKAGAIQESECVEWNGSKCISFSDPFGHGFCVIEFLAETYAGDV